MIKKLLEMYLVFFKLGCISFGGGYAMIPLIEREVVEEKKWVDKDKIVDIFAVSESLPGAIALNSSAFVGFSVYRIPGAIAALLGNLTPSVFIVLFLSILYEQFSSLEAVQSAFQGIYPAIVGLIAYAGYKIGKTALTDWVCIVIALSAFCLSTFLGIPPIPLIVFGAVAGILVTYTKSSYKKFQNKKCDRNEGI